jgi:hypothetical protein
VTGLPAEIRANAGGQGNLPEGVLLSYQPGLPDPKASENGYQGGGDPVLVEGYGEDLQGTLFGSAGGRTGRVSITLSTVLKRRANVRVSYEFRGGEAATVDASTHVLAAFPNGVGGNPPPPCASCPPPPPPPRPRRWIVAYRTGSIKFQPGEPVAGPGK